MIDLPRYFIGATDLLQMQLNLYLQTYWQANESICCFHVIRYQMSVIFTGPYSCVMSK